MSAARQLVEDRDKDIAEHPGALHHHFYLLALGSNMRHARFGPPERVLQAAIAALREEGVEIEALSHTIKTRPLGPSLRRYANLALVARSERNPGELLGLLQMLESRFGRRPGGQRWRARVLDLDIILWSGGVFASDRLIIPHPRFRERDFVLGPAAAIAPGWRDPITGLTLRQLHARLTRRGPVPR